MRPQDFGSGTSSNHQLTHLINETLQKREEGTKSPELIEYFKTQLGNSAVQYLQSIALLTPFGQAPAESWQAVVDKFVEEQVGPDASPAAKLLAEHTLIIHHSACALRQSSAGVLDPEVIRNNNSLANQLSSELRRFLKDLEELRGSARSAQLSVKSNSKTKTAKGPQARRRRQQSAA